MAKLSKYAKLQKLIYKFVIDNFKTDKETKWDADYLCEATDRFWTDCFDEVYETFKKDEVDPYEKQMTLEECIGSIYDMIFDYYENRWNHHPGYKPPRMYPELTYSFVALKRLYAAVNKLITGHNEVIYKRTRIRKATRAPRGR